MSAEVLRRAAALMRSRAEAATPGPWYTSQAGLTHPVGTEVESAAGWVTAECCSFQGSVEIPDAEHIASWHPAVALAVAEVLAFTAETWSDDRCESSRGWDETCGECVNCTRHWAQVRAHAVALAYLGDADV